jgi:hypothetical protein
MVYVNPEAAKTIAEFALARSSFRHKVKAHDIWLTAMEEFFERNGLRGPVRVPEKSRGRNTGTYYPTAIAHQHECAIGRRIPMMAKMKRGLLDWVSYV